MSSRFLVDIAEDYKQLYETREDYDVIIYVTLASDWAIKDKNSGCFIFKKPNISSSILYCGEVDIQDQGGETILELLVASDEFGLISLIDYVQYFIENQKNLLEENPVGILHVVVHHETFNKIGNNNGPDFGGNLRLNGNYVYANNNGYYPNVGILNGSQIEDYEVFQVIKK
ncbi:2053_t:CDS:2 [Gigaspora margarita]|uniref:2053_t:CDS:1 n=1 Tax=Gigaspora margarita TaxID=4874 RepID=A0ABM8W5H6_GIGMA|nr:2053_t:CDS:2 [Gigaspora margarita]